MMRGPCHRAGTLVAGAFSLLELVLALGLCAVGLVSVLGLLATTAGNVREVEDADTAPRLLGAVLAEVRHVTPAAWAGRAAASPIYFAPRHGRSLASAANVPKSERYFAVWFEPDPERTPPAGDRASPYLPVVVRIGWPYSPRHDEGFRVRHELRFSAVLSAAAP